MNNFNQDNYNKKILKNPDFLQEQPVNCSSKNIEHLKNAFARNHRLATKSNNNKVYQFGEPCDPFVIRDEGI